MKFVFATTEIRKVPVTVLSRCQRFDLRRIEAGVLVRRLTGICAKEAIAAEPEALALIARAAEGSVRDALSLLDQAISHAAGPVRAEDVRLMLGLADRARIIDLFETVMRGDAAGALKELRNQYESGADPAVMLVDLADFTHFVTRVKIVPAVADDPAFAEIERVRGRGFATALSIRVLSRTWQMLLKGIADVQAAPKPLAAAEMVLVRIAYAADLPAPEDAIRALAQTSASASTQPGGGGNAGGPSDVHPRFEQARTGARPARASAASAPQAVVAPAADRQESASAPQLAVTCFADLIALAAQKRDLMIKAALERDVRLVRFEDGRLEIALEAGASNTLAGEISRKLSHWTGRRWMVVVSTEAGAPTLKMQTEARQQELKTGVQADPLVQAVLTRFPGAEIVAVRERGGTESPADEVITDLSPADGDVPGAEPMPNGEDEF